MPILRFFDKVAADSFTALFSSATNYIHIMGSISKPTILTLHGRGLKLDTRDDIEQHLKDVDPTIIEEIHLNGNTIGVDASKALAEFLSKTQVLKVTLYSRYPQYCQPP